MARGYCIAQVLFAFALIGLQLAVSAVSTEMLLEGGSAVASQDALISRRSLLSRRRRSPPPAPKTRTLVVRMSFAFAKNDTSTVPVSEPNRRFGRDVNCTDLARLIAKDLTDATAPVAGVQITKAFKVTTCKGTKFEVKSSVVLPDATCAKVTGAISSGMLFGWVVLAMRDNQNCNAYRDIQVGTAVVTLDPAVNDVDYCVARVSTPTLCSPTRMTPQFPPPSKGRP